MNKRSFALLTTLVAGFLSTSTAFAGGPDPSAEDRATARALSAEGHKAFADKDYATAADRFARADALVHAPTLMLNLARAQVGLGKLVAANESYNRIIREDIPANSPKVWFEAKETAQNEIQALLPRLCWVTITVDGANGQEGYLKVTLDGVEVPAAAISAKRIVDPGKHLAVAVVTGGDKVGRAEGTISAEEGKSQVIPLKITLEKKAEPPQKQEGKVTPPEPPPDTGPSGRRIGAYVAGGVGIVGLVIGGVTGGMVFAKKGTVTNNCNGPDCNLTGFDAVNSAKTLGLVSTITVIAGGAALVTGTVLFFTEPKQPHTKASASSRWLSAGVSPGPQGVFAHVEGAL